MPSFSSKNPPIPDPNRPVRTSRQFPEGFLWGVSTAAHQVEGGNRNNQWSDWEAAGRIRSGDLSGKACDWWSNAERDFDLAQQMGLNALRLSVEWSRIEGSHGEVFLLVSTADMERDLHEAGIHITETRTKPRAQSSTSTRAR